MDFTVVYSPRLQVTTPQVPVPDRKAGNSPFLHRDRWRAIRNGIKNRTVHRRRRGFLRGPRVFQFSARAALARKIPSPLAKHGGTRAGEFSGSGRPPLLQISPRRFHFYHRSANEGITPVERSPVSCGPGNDSGELLRRIIFATASSQEKQRI